MKAAGSMELRQGLKRISSIRFEKRKILSIGSVRGAEINDLLLFYGIVRLPSWKTRPYE